MKKLLFAFLALTVFLTACKDDDDSHSHSDVTIAIMQPDNTDKHNGDVMHIHVNFDSDGTVHNVKVELEDMTSGGTNVLLSEHAHETDGHYEFHHDHTLSVTTHTDYVLRAKSWGDGETEADATVQELMFHCHPM